MDIKKGFQAYNIIKEIKLNDSDMLILKNVNNIEAAQITIKMKDGTYQSSIYENDRINLLLQVLYERNIELMRKLGEL